jgi:hypothetical protein
MGELDESSESGGLEPMGLEEEALTDLEEQEDEERRAEGGMEGGRIRVTGREMRQGGCRQRE